MSRGPIAQRPTLTICLERSMKIEPCPPTSWRPADITPSQPQDQPRRVDWRALATKQATDHVGQRSGLHSKNLAAAGHTVVPTVN